MSKLKSTLHIEFAFDERDLSKAEDSLINQRDYLQLSLVVAEHSRDTNAIKSSLSTIDNEVAEVITANNSVDEGI